MAARRQNTPESTVGGSADDSAPLSDQERLAQLQEDLIRLRRRDDVALMAHPPPRKEGHRTLLEKQERAHLERRRAAEAAAERARAADERDAAKIARRDAAVRANAEAVVAEHARHEKRIAQLAAERYDLGRKPLGAAALLRAAA